MTDRAGSDIQAVVDAVYRTESRRVLATLIRLLGDFDLAEEATHDAFVAAVQHWPSAGLPANPRAWLVSAGRFKAIDGLRRRARFDAALAEIANRLDSATSTPDVEGASGVDDDRLRLIFTCCHPALGGDARTALTLREVCGLTTEAIAHAFLTTPPTIAQRIVRAKAKIRDARIPYQVPAAPDLPARLDSVLHVVYLVFNEGYSASSGPLLTRADLSSEAIRLGRLIVELLPCPEALGLLALMLLHDSRRAARVSTSGEVVLLEDQDRSLWDRAQIAEGVALVERALAPSVLPPPQHQHSKSSDHQMPPPSPYAVQAAIAALHAEASSADHTDWAQIVGLYDVLARTSPSPVVSLNRAVAVAMRDGPAVGLPLVEALLADGDLDTYVFAHAARADLCRRLGHIAAARESYARALSLARQEPERRFLEKRLLGFRDWRGGSP